MTATVIDGKAFAARIREQVAAEVTAVARPGLATVLVGDDPASSTAAVVGSPCRLIQHMPAVQTASVYPWGVRTVWLMRSRSGSQPEMSKILRIIE